MANESEFDSNVKFKGGEGGVTVGLRRNNVPWWIVLLLLPLLLLIKCNKEITVHGKIPLRFKPRRPREDSIINKFKTARNIYFFKLAQVV